MHFPMDVKCPQRKSNNHVFDYFYLRWKHEFCKFRKKMFLENLVNIITLIHRNLLRCTNPKNNGITLIQITE